jgi:translation initiation factor IF-3
VRIDQNDYLIKLRRAEEFLLDSNKVKLTMFFRNREANMTDVGWKSSNAPYGTSRMWEPPTPHRDRQDAISVR